MKKLCSSLAGLMIFGLCAKAQLPAGKVTFERTIQLQIRIASPDGNGTSPDIENMLPRTRTDRFELQYANNQSLWKQLEEEQDADDMSFNGNGGNVQIRMIGAGAEDIIFTNLAEAKRVEQRELGTKKFIIEDSIRPLSWKLSDETKTILGHLCRKATSQRIQPRMTMTMDNGKMEKKEIQDTANIVVWFATDIPVSAGPAEYQGQLPGLILEIDVNNGRTLYKAVELSAKVDQASIKEPKGPKRITPAEFAKERDKMMEEMQRSNSGPGRMIRISN